MWRRGLSIDLILLSWVAWSSAGAAPDPVWVFFHDKPDGGGGRIVWQELGVEHPAEELDLPVDGRYLEQVEEAGIAVRVVSRWLNAVSVRATSQQRAWLENQPFVTGLRTVGRFRRPPPREEPVAVKLRARVDSPDYDLSFEQLAQIRVIALHELGYKGQGVRVAVLDNGFHYAEHAAFARLRVVGARDFVNGDEVVTDEDDQPVTGNETQSDQNIHGAEVLSLLAGYEPGRFIGAAPEGEYILAKTEDNRSELPIEEDRWIAGLEWADSLGADVVNSSLGYNIWDDGSGYTYEQLDGATALTTLAAEMAVRQGLIVVSAAGNEGDGPWRYVTAPADAPGVISVGAVDVPPSGLRDPVLAGSSSRGPTADGRIKPDVVAPGQGVIVADIRGRDYVRTNGTSFATPLVSGVCALLLQIDPSLRRQPAKVQQILRETAADLGPAGPDTAYGWGLVDAVQASGLQIRLPDASVAGAPFPNPATADVIFFPLQLRERDEVELRIFNLVGGLIYEKNWDLVAGDYTRRKQALRWEIDPDKGKDKDEIANGLYFYQLRSSTFLHSGKIALVRHRR